MASLLTMGGYLRHQKKNHHSTVILKTIQSRKEISLNLLRTKYIYQKRILSNFKLEISLGGSNLNVNPFEKELEQKIKNLTF